MNRRDFVLTLIGASGTVAAGGAYVLDLDPTSDGDAGTPNATAGEETDALSTGTATESPARSPTSTGTASATPSSTPTETQRSTRTGTTSPTRTRTRSPTRTRTRSATGTQTQTPTGTTAGTRTSTRTPDPRDGVRVDAKSQSKDDKRLLVKVTNTNDYPVYVEVAATWRFEDGSTDTRRRGGVVTALGTDTVHFITASQGTVTDWSVELSSVRRI